jgi:hypothetical protein
VSCKNVLFLPMLEMMCEQLRLLLLLLQLFLKP